MKHLGKIILKLGQEKISFKYFSIFSSGRHFVQWSKTLLEISVNF